MRIMATSPDVILKNGRVHTVDRADRLVEAVALSGNRIFATGSTPTISALANRQTEVIDLRGRSVIPGIIDSHNHAWEAGKLLEGLITFGIGSISELQAAVRAKAATLAPGQWLQGGGFIESQFRERRFPNRWDLDEAAPDTPVVLERIFSACVANSRALTLAGITRDTPDPLDGEIDRDRETGEPTGVLRRAAKLLVRQAMPGPFGAAATGGSTLDTELAIKRAHQEYVQYGITGVVEPGLTPAMMRAYQNLRQAGQLMIRTCLMPNWYGFALAQELDYMARLIDELGLYTGFGDDWLRLGALKMAIDGGLTSKTALSSFAYAGEDGPRRDLPLRLDLTQLDSWVQQAHDAGWSVGIHVVGDIAQDRAVAAIHAAHTKNPAPRRHQIIHGYYPTAKSLKQMQEAKIIAALQPAFIYGEADGYPELLSPEQQQQFLPLKSYLQAGVKVAASTDMPSAHHNPFFGVYSALTRRGMQGHALGTAECIDLTEALRMLTINGAYLTGEEDSKGSIEPGKLADLVVLDRDLLACSPEEIRDTVVDLTFIDGRLVHARC